MPDEADRRSRRTRESLSSALIALMLEKPFSAITVQDIVDRANVGRSTFYAHYQGKEDLLSSELGRLVEALSQSTHSDPAESNSLIPSLQLFRHVQQHYQLYKALVIWGQGLTFFSSTTQAFQVSISNNVENQLEAVLETQHQTSSTPLPILANYVAGAFLTLLKWWLDNNMIYSPERMDELFRQLVMPGVQAALGVKL